MNDNLDFTGALDAMTGQLEKILQTDRYHGISSQTRSKLFKVIADADTVFGVLR